VADEALSGAVEAGVRAMVSKSTTDALELLHRRFYAGKPMRLKSRDAARANEEIARKLLELRTEAGLTQAQLAKLIGTTTSVISRLEDADYAGHSLAVESRALSSTV
jgi:DNA-binding XRE family transcriptional regulator